MSYVLDALKKADAERDRGSVPGLHAQPVPGLLDEPARRPALPAWAWTLAGAAVMLPAAWLGLDWMRETPPAPPPANTAQPMAELSAKPPAPVPAPLTQAPQPAGLQSAALPPPARTPTQTSAPAPALQPQRPAERPPVPQPTARSSTAAATLPAAKQTPATSAGSHAEGRIPAIAELPPEIRRALPQLQVGGSVYSEHAPSRFVIINGQVFHENDTLAPDLTLEQIRLKLAVLRYKDVRFRIMF